MGDYLSFNKMARKAYYGMEAEEVERFALYGIASALGSAIENVGSVSVLKGGMAEATASSVTEKSTSVRRFLSTDDVLRVIRRSGLMSELNYEDGDDE